MVKRNRLLSLLVAALMLLSTVFTGAVPAFADDTEEPAETVKMTEEVDSREESDPITDVREKETIDPDLDTDGDGIPDVDELYTFGTDPENADTDGDGLSDCDELYVYYTAAGDPDSDGDGLSDSDELFVYGTDPLKNDTDSDGLSDGDELYYGTNPLDQDADGDGIMDGDELLLGTDPLSYENISEVFQTLGKGTIDGTLYADNAAVPAIEGYAPFVLYREAVVMHYGVESFLKNPALIGKPVEIRMPVSSDLILRFTVNSKAEEIAIFRMNENGTIRLDAERNSSDYTVALTENGVYYAADMHKLNVFLGFEGAGTQNLPKNSYLLEDFRYVTLSAPLSADSDADTDGDGIPDCEEITGQYEIDLGNGYTATVYGYVSDPTLVDSDFDGIEDSRDALPRSNTFSGRYTSGNYTINLSYTMNYQNFFGDNKTYNSEIAGFSVWAAQFCYENEDGDTKFVPTTALTDSDGSTITTVYRVDQLMRAHGMENVVDYKLGSGYSNDGLSLEQYSDDDMSEAFFGHHKETVNGETVEVISVYVRGTNGTEEEWSSNFEIGDLYRYDNDIDVSSVKQKQQSNADWNRKTNHRGFDVCATRFLNALSKYVDKYVDAEATPVFWFSGHSRGAAIANIMSSYCVDAGNKVFGYTYASPYTTANTEASAEKYDCIFNLVNGDDFVPRLPMPEWGFTRYGRTEIYFASTIDSSTRSSVLSNSSYNYKKDSDLQALVKKFADMTVNNAGGNDGWIDVYRYHCGHQHADEQLGESRSGCTRTWQIGDIGSGVFSFSESMFTSWSQRVQRYAYWNASNSGICETPAYAMQVLAELMGNLSLSGGWDYLTTNKLADRYDFGKTSLVSYATGIIDPHYMENYYLIQYELMQEGNPDSQFTTLAPYTTTNANGGRPVHEHQYEIVEILEEPTCTEEGLAHLVCHCSAINSAWYDDEIKEAVLPALGHDWSEPVWTWDGVTGATATFTCGNDSTHVETRSTTEITRSENGDTAVYTATVEFEGETYTGTKTVGIGYYLIGSMTDWEVDEAYRFAANTAAQGEYILNAALAVGDEIKVVRAEGAAKLQWYPDNGANYPVDYAHSGSVNVYFRPAGNDDWNDFFAGGFFYISRLHTAEVITDGNGTASIAPETPDVTATVTLTAVPNSGFHYAYTEIYERTGAGENDLELMELGALGWNDTDKTFTMPGCDIVIKVYFAGHAFGAPSYTWEAEGSGWKCVATRACSDCGLTETETVTATAETTEPTCTAAGSTVYTAAFENEAFEAQTKTVEIPAIGHEWGEPTYEWAEDNSSVTATRICEHDSTHIESETVTTTSEVTKEPTTTEMGETTYTATFRNEAFEPQTKTAADIPMISTVTITLNPCNGGESAAITIEIPVGGTIEAFPTVTYSEHKLIGWFTEAATNAFTAGTGTEVTTGTVFNEAATIYAHWYMPGDINGDGKVNNKDVTRLLKYLAGDEVEFVAAALDVNGDGKVNNKDVTRLLKHLAGDEVEIF